jgi:hypothetical protein
LPSKDIHLTKAQRNDALAAVLEAKTKYYDWAATVMFYSALHYVDAVLADDLIHPERHTSRPARDGKAEIPGRDTYIAKHHALKKIYPEYEALKTTSNNARYFALEVDAEMLHERRKDFDVLKGYIRKLLKLDE